MNQINERAKEHLDQLPVDVVLPWSHYHNLNASPAARLFTNAKDADDYAEDANDEIIHVNAFQAARAAAAFDLMCAAAWTPNQKPDERSESLAISADCKRIIDTVRTLAAANEVA